MQFQNSIHADLPPFFPNIKLTYEINESSPSIMSNSGLCKINSNVFMSFQEENYPTSVLAETSERGSITPVESEIDENDFTKQYSMYSDPSATPSVRFFFLNSGNWIGPIEFKIPSYNSCRIANRLLFERPNVEDIKNLCELYNTEIHSDAVFSLLRELKGWIPLDIYYQILNIASKLSVDVKNAVSENGTVTFLTRQLISREYYNIQSKLRLSQIVENVNSLSELPSISVYRVFGRALSIVESNQDFDQLWELEQQYELARDNWENILRDDQLTALLGRAAVDGEISHAQEIIEAWIGPSESIDDINTKIQKARDAEENTSLELWRSILRYAVNEPLSTFEYVVASYLYQFYKTEIDDLDQVYTEEEICRCSHILFDRQNVEAISLFMEYQYYAAAGQRHRQQENFSEAENAYENYLATSLECIQNDVRGTNKPWPIYWLYKTRADLHRKNEDHNSGIKALDEGQNLLKSIESSVDQGVIEDLVTQMKALHHEIQADKELADGNLNSAYGHYGRAIGFYTDQDAYQARRYLKQRRKLIESSLAEQEGDFQKTKEAHEAIIEITEDEKFRQFNRARVNIAQAKQNLVNLNIEEARDVLPVRLDKSNVAHVESQNLAFLLDIISEYKENNLQDVGSVLDKLQSLPDLSEASDPFPFEYGHDYRPAIVNTLAAQRLKRLDLDHFLLDELLEISIKEVLAPKQGQQQIAESGIASIDLRAQWKQYFPIHIVRRYQETREKEISGVDNYVDEGLALLKLVEQALELSADYYAQREFGANWPTEFVDNEEGRLAMGPLRNLLNTSVMEGIIWRNSVRELIDQPLIDEETLIEARNALGHDRRSRISEKDYEEIRDRVELILTRMAADIPVIVTVSGQTLGGLYELTAHWENSQKTIRVKTEHSMENGKRYYIPLEGQTLDPVATLNEDRILPVQADRVLYNLNDYLNSE